MTVYSVSEWAMLIRLPGRVLVAAASAPGAPERAVAQGVAGLAGIAAGRVFDSDLVRAVVAAIYSETDPDPGRPVTRPPRGYAGSGPSRRSDPLLPPCLRTDCRTVVTLLARRADPADSAAYRQWVQSVAAQVRRAADDRPAEDGGRCGAGPGATGCSTAERQFMAELAAALDLS